MAVYAVMETGGKQYRVQEGDVVFVEKLEVEAGTDYIIDKVLAVSGENGFNAGAPYVENARINTKVLGHGKNKKIIVFKYKAKKGYRRKQGHRQPYTKLEIDKIVG